MRSHLYALSLAAVVAVPVWAQLLPPPTYGNPCSILHGDGYQTSYAGPTEELAYCYAPPGKALREEQHRNIEMSQRLAAQTITDLRTLIGEIRGLRTEMKEYQQKLVQAKANYDATIKTNTASQEAWQAKALNDTLESVEKIPARLALDENLRKALLAGLKDELPKDPDFIETLRQRTAP